MNSLLDYKVDVRRKDLRNWGGGGSSLHVSSYLIDNENNIYDMLNHNIRGVLQNCVTINIIQFIEDTYR